jgi:uracil-DNA glycosylase
MRSIDDEIREKYLERAIRELNQMNREVQDCRHCPRGKLMPVLGSGHPQADVLMLKHAPLASEIEEGVAFYGRAGNALMKSFKRLGIDPLVVYGTLCVKCPIPEPDLAAGECIARLVEELAIVQPKIVVVMGEPSLRILNSLGVPLSRPLEAPLKHSASGTTTYRPIRSEGGRLCAACRSGRRRALRGAFRLRAAFCARWRPRLRRPGL